MNLEAISTEPIREKLRKLRELMPGEEQIVYDFAEFLADRLSTHPNLVPQGFVVAAELALYDAKKGVDGFTGRPISGRLHGYPPPVYAVLSMRVQGIADVVCPEDFAEGIRAFKDKVYASLKEGE